MNFAVPANHKVKLRESKKRDKQLDIAREMKEIIEHERDGDTNCNWCTQYSHQRFGIRTRGLGNKRTN